MVSERVGASIRWRRLECWTGLVGYILAFIDEGGDQQDIGAPITAVAWDFEARTTEVRTGYAT